MIYGRLHVRWCDPAWYRRYFLLMKYHPAYWKWLTREPRDTLIIGRWDQPRTYDQFFPSLSRLALRVMYLVLAYFSVKGIA